MGFATLPNQVHRKSVKKGFDFTLMVAGRGTPEASPSSPLKGPLGTGALGQAVGEAERLRMLPPTAGAELTCTLGESGQRRKEEETPAV